MIWFGLVLFSLVNLGWFGFLRSGLVKFGLVNFVFFSFVRIFKTHTHKKNDGFRYRVAAQLVKNGQSQYFYIELGSVSAP